jgi:hypothetical protein
MVHDSDENVSFALEVDFLGDGSWQPYETFRFPKGYRHHEFPDGFSAHWVRVRVDRACKTTVYFMYN